MRPTILAIIAASIATGTVAHATTYCVTSADELTAALAAVDQAPDVEHEIRIRTGTYTAPTGGWHVDVHQSGRIVVAGGYNGAPGACPEQRLLDPALTRLDGHKAERPLTINTSFDQDLPFAGGQITISGLTFENGLGTAAGGLKISDAGPIFDGSILVERNIFRNNVGTAYAEDDSAGALLAATDGSDFSGNVFLIVRNNLFTGNRAPDGAAATLFSNNTIDVTLNTFSMNQSTGERPNEPVLVPHKAVASFTLSGIVYVDNIFWNNNPDDILGTFDLRADNSNRADLAADLFNNDLQAVFGQPGTVSNNVVVDPGFVDAAQGDFRLVSNSPLVDAGKDDPDGGFAIVGAQGGATAVDLQGSFRVQGLHVDIGAYETADGLFTDGFEATP